MKWIKVTCISNILTEKSCPHEARIVPNRNVDSERHPLKNGDKVAASSWIVKVKITKNVPNVLSPKLLFSVNSTYSSGCILSGYSIESNVLLQVLLATCVWVKTI